VKLPRCDLVGLDGVVARGKELAHLSDESACDFGK
jgi:hypothetical protein